MYIWTAIDINDQLGELRTLAKSVEKEIGFEHSAFTLPSHISLKISFFVEDEVYPRVIETLLDYYKTVKPFFVDAECIEIDNNIVWLRMNENPMINQIHKDLDRILSEKHEIVPHPFDLNFKFHSTLFLDSDKDKIEMAYSRIRDAKFPLSLCANKLIIGASPSGKVGTYGVTHTIDLLKN